MRNTKHKIIARASFKQGLSNCNISHNQLNEIKQYVLGMDDSATIIGNRNGVTRKMVNWRGYEVVYIEKWATGQFQLQSICPGPSSPPPSARLRPFAGSVVKRIAASAVGGAVLKLIHWLVDAFKNVQTNILSRRRASNSIGRAKTFGDGKIAQSIEKIQPLFLSLGIWRVNETFKSSLIRSESARDCDELAGCRQRRYLPSLKRVKKKHTNRSNRPIELVTRMGAHTATLLMSSVIRDFVCPHHRAYRLRT